MNATPLIIRARAPLRVSFGGGGTDVPPYPQKYGGAVISTTIDKHAYCTISEPPTEDYIFKSVDFELSEAYPDLGSVEYNGKLDLAKAVVKTVCGHDKRKFELSIFSEAPPGSGLGSSSALMVAVIRAVTDFLGVHKSNQSIADLAYKLERLELKIKGGLQDQYACTYGGFNFIEFSRHGVAVNRLQIREDILRELLASLVLIDTGKARMSSNILTRQIDCYERGEAEVMEALGRIKQIAFEMKSAVLHGDLITFGKLLGDEWEWKKRLDKMITNPQIEFIYKKALQHGAVGGKVLGAGNGGHMLFFVEFGRRRDLLKCLELEGYRAMGFNFDSRGVISWRLKENGIVA